MNQYAKNACGTIALVHLILNAAEEHPDILNQGSFLNSFLTTTQNKTSVERGHLFKGNSELLNEHK